MTQVGTPSQFQLDHKILVSCMAAYPSRPPGLLKLIESCEKFGVQLTIFGEGEHFDNMYENKLRRLGECIREVCFDYKFIINIDAADTLFLRPLEEMEEMIDRIYNLNWMMFAGELNCFPFTQLKELYDTTKESDVYQYLNGGGFCGRMSSVLLMFSYMAAVRQEGHPRMMNDFTHTLMDDQGAWAYEYCVNKKTLIHNSGPGLTFPTLGIDTCAGIFQTLCLVDQEKDLRIEDGKLFNNITGTQPFILHANGSSDYQNIYEKIIKNG